MARMNKRLRHISAVMLASCVRVACADPPRVSAAGTDPAIRYVGRFDTRDPAGPRCTWSASSVRIRFRGTALYAVLNEQGDDLWQVELDGKAILVLAPEKGSHRIAVVSGLADGAAGVTRRQVKWLLRPAFEQWRDIGLRGFGFGGQRRPGVARVQRGPRHGVRRWPVWHGASAGRVVEHPGRRASGRGRRVRAVPQGMAGGRLHQGRPGGPLLPDPAQRHEERRRLPRPGGGVAGRGDRAGPAGRAVTSGCRVGRS